MTTWTVLRTVWTRRSDLLRTHCGPSRAADALTCAFGRSERVNMFDADEHSVAGAIVGEARAGLGCGDCPACCVVGSVVESHGWDVAEVADQPSNIAVGGHIHSVCGHTVLDRRVGKLRLAAHRGSRDLASGLAGLGFDEHVALRVGVERLAPRRRCPAWPGSREHGLSRIARDGDRLTVRPDRAAAKPGGC